MEAEAPAGAPALRAWDPLQPSSGSGSSGAAKASGKASSGSEARPARGPAYSSTCILAVVGSVAAVLAAVCVGVMGSA